MKIVVAPDKFKGTLSAGEACEAICRGLVNVIPEALIEAVPMADGGEGTVETLILANKGRQMESGVTDPNGKPVVAAWGICDLAGTKTAVIEMAAASGLRLARNDKRPMSASTYGTGELIKAALDENCARMIVGIGGSATTDGGAGAAQALGVKLLDGRGRTLPRGGGPLRNLAKIDTSGLDERLGSIEIIIASDVDNPLYGADGAAHVYGPQKGASATDIGKLDEGLRRLAAAIKNELGLDIAGIAGAGAAGGLGAGLIAFAGAKIRPGVELIGESVRLGEHLRGAALAVTGEGQIDRQTCYGKVPLGVARLAKENEVPVVAIAGSIGPGADAVYECGINAMEPTCIRPMDFQEAAGNASDLVRQAAERIARLMLTGRSLAQYELGDLGPT